ncbi:MAG TPA: FHA domain-containing protein [Anaerolineae bacterium]|nr:FHA domain-containing protein [Anaerolineae bacterium]
MEPNARLVISGPQGTERTVALAEADVTVGRATTNDIVLSDAKASRAHAQLVYGDAQWTLVDLGSANGTLLNGQPVLERTPLQPGDVISVGDSALRFDTGLAVPSGPLVIDSPADLEATLADVTVPVQLNDTHVARLAIQTPTGTWELPLQQEALLIGRQSDCDVVLSLERVSRQHARIERRGDAFWLRDLGSTNGTFLAGRRIEEQPLHDGDTVRIGDAQLVFKQAASPDDLTLMDAGGGFRYGADAYSTHGEGRLRQPVVFVPGLMGSELWLGSEKVWPNVRLLFTQPEIFTLPETVHLEPRGIVGEVVLVPKFVEQEQYSRAGDFLEEALGYQRGRDLLEFAYDWRQDVRQSAQRLAEAIDAWPVTPPITIIAHSLGTLVSRYYIERLGGKHKVGRVVLIGGPHQGTPRIATDLIQGVGLLPFGLFGDRLLDVIKTFPSVYQILPTYPCAIDQNDQPIDLLADEQWLPAEQIPLLRLAREFRAELGTRSSVPAVSVFGYGLETVTDLQVTRAGDGRWSKLDFKAKPGGDNRIPEHSAILDGSDVHPVQQGHGSLYVDNDVKARLKVELLR